MGRWVWVGVGWGRVGRGGDGRRKREEAARRGREGEWRGDKHRLFILLLGPESDPSPNPLASRQRSVSVLVSCSRPRFPQSKNPTSLQTSFREELVLNNNNTGFLSKHPASVQSLTLHLIPPLPPKTVLRDTVWERSELDPSPRLPKQSFMRMPHIHTTQVFKHPEWNMNTMRLNEDPDWCGARGKTLWSAGSPMLSVITVIIVFANVSKDGESAKEIPTSSRRQGENKHEHTQKCVAATPRIVQNYWNMRRRENPLFKSTLK